MNVNVSEWFETWLRLHKGINHHARFPDYESIGREEVYAGWIEAFDREDVRRDEAASASRRMQAMDRREVYPEHHLAILLGLVRRARAVSGPSAAEQARLVELSRTCREREREEDATRAAWKGLAPEVREHFRRSVRRDHPEPMCGFGNYVEFMARGRWVDSVRGVSSPVPPPAPGIGEGMAPTEAPPDGEFLEFTPAQMAFLASLTPGQLRRFDAMSLPRRREVLAPFADDFDRRLFEVMAFELRPAVESMLEPATTG